MVMETTAYLTNEQSRPCECGGKTQLTPSERLKHVKSWKHRNYEFLVLCVQFLECEEKVTKVEMLKRMKALLVNA